MSNTAENQQQVSEHWSAAARKALPGRIRWWMSPTIVRHINRLICGEDVAGVNGGLARLLELRLAGRTLTRGVSVGCGTGEKEVSLMRRSMVETFDLFELSVERVRQGKELAARTGLAERAVFRDDDPFTAYEPESLDLVFWVGSLHHMFDVDAAVAWSRTVLRPGGVMYVEEFVGPDRFQWSDATLALTGLVRQALPDRCFLPLPDSEQPLSRQIARPNAALLARDDPSESVQSSRILPAIANTFPNADLIPLGGAIYSLALQDVLHHLNEDDESDAALLRELLLFDTFSVHLPEIDCLYAATLAIA